MNHDEEPAVPSPVVADPDHGPHSHPLPISLRIGAAVYGLLLAVVLGTLLSLYLSAEQRRDEQIADAKQAVLIELEKRSAARDAEAVRQDADARETRRLVDDLRRELAALRVLAEVAGLDTSSVPATEPRRPAPSPMPTQEREAEPQQARPTPTATRRPRPSPRPTPKPSPTCRIPNPLGGCLNT